MNRDRDSFAALRAEIVSSEKYDPYSRELDEVNALLDAGDFEAAHCKLTEAMPNLFLSPAAHLAIAYVAEQTDDEESAKMEAFLAAMCCEGILTTGEGSRANPYLVLRTSDEYDVLQYLGKSFTGQALVEDGERHLDRMTCADGTELWFDITDAYNQLAQRSGEN